MASSSTITATTTVNPTTSNIPLRLTRDYWNPLIVPRGYTCHLRHNRLLNQALPYAMKVKTVELHIDNNFVYHERDNEPLVLSISDLQKGVEPSVSNLRVGENAVVYELYDGYSLVDPSKYLSLPCGEYTLEVHVPLFSTVEVVKERSSRSGRFLWTDEHELLGSEGFTAPYGRESGGFLMQVGREACLWRLQVEPVNVMLFDMEMGHRMGLLCDGNREGPGTGPVPLATQPEPESDEETLADDDVAEGVAEGSGRSSPLYASRPVHRYTRSMTRDLRADVEAAGQEPSKKRKRASEDVGDKRRCPMVWRGDKGMRW